MRMLVYFYTWNGSPTRRHQKRKNGGRPTKSDRASDAGDGGGAGGARYDDGDEDETRAARRVPRTDEVLPAPSWASGRRSGRRTRMTCGSQK